MESYKACDIEKVFKGKYQLLCWQYDFINDRVKSSKIQKVIDKFNTRIEEYRKHYSFTIIDNTELNFRFEKGLLGHQYPPKGGTGECK